MFNFTLTPRNDNGRKNFDVFVMKGVVVTWNEVNRTISHRPNSPFSPTSTHPFTALRPYLNFLQCVKCILSKQSFLTVTRFSVTYLLGFFLEEDR